MKNASLKTILTCIVGFLCILSMGTGLPGVFSLRSVLQHEREITTNSLPSVRLAGKLYSDTLAFRLGMRRIVESRSAEELGRMIDALKGPAADLIKDSADYEKLINSTEERAQWDQFNASWKKFESIAERIVGLMKAGTPDKALDLFNSSGLDDIGAANKALFAIIDINNAQATAQAEASEAVGSLVTNLNIALLVLSAAAAFGAILVVRGRVIGPIGSITGAMKELSTGNLAATVPFTDRGDELGQMAGAVQVFKENAVRVKALEEEERKVAAERLRRAQSMVEVVTEVGEVVRRAAEGDFSARLQVTTDDPEMAKLVAGINEINKVVDAATGDFADVLGSLAQGDLTRTVRTSYRGRFDELKQALNETIDRLSVTVSTIQGTAREVSAAAGEINTGANDLSSRTEQQASSLEETAATTEELAASVKASAASSRNAVDLAEQAMGVARDGGDIATKAVEAMSRIESASQKISDITGVIDEIAFQTNLLALNAAVEAARAGDAGKGFAVVASEVRTLAQRSSEAAKEITALINASVAEVGQGVQLVRSAGDALGKIVEASQKVTATVTDISTAAAEQANGIDEMSQAVAHMDEMTQQNAALAEESAASASSLSDQIGRLNDLVAAFKVSGSASGSFGTPTIPHALRERAQQAFAGAKPRTPAKAPAKAAAMAPKAPARTGTWDEF